MKTKPKEKPINALDLSSRNISEMTNAKKSNQSVSSADNMDNDFFDVEGTVTRKIWKI